MGSNGNHHDLQARASSVGTSSGDGGGGGGGETSPPAPPRLPLSPPPTSPSRDPRALATSPPPLQPPRPPPRAAGQDTDEGLDDDYTPEEEDDGGWNWEEEEAEYEKRHLEEEELLRMQDEGLDGDYMPEEEDDGGWNWEKEEAEYNKRRLEEEELEDGDEQDQEDNLRGPSDSEFFSILFKSDRRYVPDDIIRNGFVPLNKLEYFSRYRFWSQLLGRYRSYLRPPKDHLVANGGFRRPYDYPRALGFQEPISQLIVESSNNYIIQEKIKVLSKQYGLFRRTWSHGSCFYKALLFSYLENLGQMQDRQAEVIRLMKCVEVSVKRFYELEWEEAYFLTPDEYFLSVIDDFYYLVNSVANGLTSDKLYERSLEETSSGRIISFLRLLTEIEIRTQDIYKPFIPRNTTVLQFCRKEVRGLYAEAEAIEMRALTYALGIPLRVEIVDRKKWADQAVRVKRLDFFRRSDLGKGPFQLVRSYYSSSTAHEPLEWGSEDDLLSSDGAPLLTLLSRRGHCDILYPG